MELSKEILHNIYGGGKKLGIFVSIGGLLTFIIGVIDGYLRPLKCNK